MYWCCCVVLGGHAHLHGPMGLMLSRMCTWMTSFAGPWRQPSNGKL